jgi:beta-xylosidase
MVEAVMLWNEPNNLSHWNFQLDPGWEIFAKMVVHSARAIRECNPKLRIVLGGVSSCDVDFLRLMSTLGALDAVDAVAVHGFPLDWNHWSIDEWPDRIAEAEDVAGKPVWVSEVGVSSFGAEEVQVFGLERTYQLLANRVPRIHWYSLFDLPPTWPATTRHKEAEGSSYYRHYYMGLIKADGSPKRAAQTFLNSPGLGICQWFHYEDPRLEEGVRWLHELNVNYLRTGISWSDSLRPGAEQWFDRQMRLLEPFHTTITLCFTPEHLGLEAHYTSPPRDLDGFSDFARWAVRRYAPAPSTAPVRTLSPDSSFEQELLLHD